VHIDPDVYVPRWLSEPLARRAIERLPATGTAIDVCTGSGAIAAVLRAHRPHARVLASDVDAKAVACAITNDVDAYLGDLFTPLPDDLLSSVDVVVGVAPYVPTPELPLLQRDTFTFERPLSYDGGPDGTNILRRVIRDAPRLLRPGGALLLELGGDQPRLLTVELTDLGFVDVTMLTDEDGDARGLEATMGPS
jgi:release factor glutamine methyltransferase